MGLVLREGMDIFWASLIKDIFEPESIKTLVAMFSMTAKTYDVGMSLSDVADTWPIVPATMHFPDKRCPHQSSHDDHVSWIMAASPVKRMCCVSHTWVWVALVWNSQSVRMSHDAPDSWTQGCWSIGVDP